MPVLHWYLIFWYSKVLTCFTEVIPLSSKCSNRKSTEKLPFLIEDNIVLTNDWSMHYSSINNLKAVLIVGSVIMIVNDNYNVA